MKSESVSKVSSVCGPVIEAESEITALPDTCPAGQNSLIEPKLSHEQQEDRAVLLMEELDQANQSIQILAQQYFLTEKKLREKELLKENSIALPDTCPAGQNSLMEPKLSHEQQEDRTVLLMEELDQANRSIQNLAQQYFLTEKKLREEELLKENSINIDKTIGNSTPPPLKLRSILILVMDSLKRKPSPCIG